MKSNGFLVLAVAILLVVCFGVLSMFGVGTGHIAGLANIRQGLDLKGGVSILYEAGKPNPTNSEMTAAISLIQRRLDNKNYTEAQVGQQGANQIRVDIPGVADAEQAVQQIGATAMLYFVDSSGAVLLTGADVASAKATTQQTTQGAAAEYVVALEFTSDGAAKFATATQNNIGKQISIYLDQDLLSSPTVNTAITDGRGVIQGSFTAQSARDLATSISEGSLPFALNTISVQNIGATLGATALSTSVFAGIIGSILVLLFMALFYRTLGAAADVALLLYIGINLVVISLLRITLTLPGIAGIILSIGMAVDANVIIFERMREEIASGKSLKAAVHAGFKRAFNAIIDSHVTTFIAALVLFFLGTGTIKGFAETLMIGIAVSLFTAFLVTRILVYALIDAGATNPRVYLRLKGEAKS